VIYFFSYDISDGRRRRKAAAKLEQFGIRIQKSLFQCDVDPSLAEDIKADMRLLINPKEDSLLCFPICAGCFLKVSLLGKGELAQNREFQIL
jgi:CRISPR-associated protein Cas2